MEFDVVFLNGTVIDGSGAKPLRADVGVRGDRIAAIGDLSNVESKEEVDCSGLTVSPGFIDIHTHYDPQILWDPELTPTSWYGVTTVILGNCGFNLAPIRPELHDSCIEVLGNVEAMSVEALKTGISWDFETFAEYLEAVERRSPALNFGVLAGHTSLRLYSLGVEGAHAPADAAGIKAMQKAFEDAMSAGAFGLSTSRSPSHVGIGGRPVPSRMATTDEIFQLADVLREGHVGLVQGVNGPGLKIADFARLARTTGRPVTWTSLHQGVDGGKHWDMSHETSEARHDGVDIWAQMSCEPIVSQFTLEQPYFFASMPAFSGLVKGTREQRKAAFADPAWRKEADRQLSANVEKRSFEIRSDRILVAESPSRPELVGKFISDIGGSGRTTLDVMTELSLADDLKTRFDLIMFNYEEDDVAKLLAEDSSLLGLSDAGAHASQICDAAFALQLLGRYVRERGDFPLEFGVWRLTGHPASVFGISERGLLKDGYFADICVFDAKTVRQTPSQRVYDLPAGADRLIKHSIGIEHVMVNGTFIRYAGQSRTGTARGRRLRPS